MSGAWGDRLVPKWIPAEDRLRLDLSELAEANPDLERECRRLSEAIDANVAAYRVGAEARPSGLCTRYRYARLGEAHSNLLHEAEVLLGGTILVAYARPLVGW